ncbi:MAG: hypothetical protein H6868_04835 [Rhodospirillales bacterium]|nr:hypothetical protein [Rhodospirillales bacterium]
MTDTISDATRAQIAEFLPRALGTAIASYELFFDRQPEEKEDPKDFKAHHDACKVAIAHIELLIKLAKWAEVPENCAGDEQAMLIALLAQAQAEIDQNAPPPEE